MGVDLSPYMEAASLLPLQIATRFECYLSCCDKAKLLLTYPISATEVNLS